MYVRTKTALMKARIYEPTGLFRLTGGVRGSLGEGAYCDDWAAKGECAANPEYMLEFCKKSCGVC